MKTDNTEFKPKPMTPEQKALFDELFGETNIFQLAADVRDQRRRRNR